MNPSAVNTSVSIHNGNLCFFNNNTNNSVGSSYTKADLLPKVIGKQNLYSKQRKLILKNYQRFVHNYNDQIKILNQEVKNYNQQCQKCIVENEMKDQSKALNQKLRSKLGKVSIIEYNKAVEIENTLSSNPVYLKKKHTSIKKITETTFSLIIFKYAMQMHSKNKILESVPATTVRSLQKVQVNPYNLANTVINEVLTLPYTKRTIQNHVNRLIDAGVLVDHEFKGYYFNKDPKKRAGKPSEYHVNSEIMVVFDDKTKKTLSIENQLFKYGSEKNFHYDSIVTRTIINNNNINEIVNKSHSNEKEFVQQILPSFLKSPKVDNKNIYKNTNSVSSSKKSPRQLENFDQSSEILRESIDTKYDLCYDLDHNKYDDHRFCMQREFEREYLYGNMSKSEFLELLQHEFMKLAAPLYKNKTVYSGSWSKAYNDIKRLFLNNNGSIPGKANLLNTFNALHWRITYAKRCQNSKRKSWRALFPTQYFDPTRTTNKSGGFAHTLEFWKKEQERRQNEHLLKSKRRQEAAIRNRRYKAIDDFHKKVKHLTQGKITIGELQDFIYNNNELPDKYKFNITHFISQAYMC